MKTCQRCGHMDLHWSQIDGKWRLLTIGGQLHVCKSKPVAKPPNEPKPFWSPEAYIQKTIPLDLPPREALFDFHHEWWKFVDSEPPYHMRKKKAEQTTFETMVP